MMTMSIKALSVSSAGAALLLAANVTSLAAAELKIGGAPAVAIPIIAPNKAAIEKETGLTLSMTVNNEFRGANP
jgi:hypothetical protein